MSINYKPLWKLLIDKEITKSELRVKTGIAPSTLSKMTRNEYVSMDILVRICNVLKCQLNDVVEVKVGNNNNEN
ncbi:DNA-binding Xre family transcriptional regulator [Sporosarcina luteola]|nr:DNA-binding Xre family transcriptional regulator [Sporosarcina luteola]